MDELTPYLYGVAVATSQAANPMLELVSGKAIIFSWTLPSCWWPDAVEDFKRGVHSVLPDCQFLIGSKTCRGH